MNLTSLQSGIILNIVYNFPNKMVEAKGKWTTFSPVHGSATLTLKTWGSQKEEEIHKGHITPMVQFIIFTYRKNTILERSLLPKIFSVLHSRFVVFWFVQKNFLKWKWRDESWHSHWHHWRQFPLISGEQLKAAECWPLGGNKGALQG